MLPKDFTTERQQHFLLAPVPSRRSARVRVVEFFHELIFTRNLGSLDKPTRSEEGNRELEKERSQIG